ncbi:unnamed protein product [Eretmochelys imbricata]
MFASNPLEQLVSAHRDKHLHSEPFCSVILANKRRATFRENNNATEKVSFQEVVNFILKKPKGQNKANKKTIPTTSTPSPHQQKDIWTFIGMFLLCNIHYDITRKCETPQQSVEHVLMGI